MKRPLQVLPKLLLVSTTILAILLRAAPKAIANLPAAINDHGRDHLRAALGLAVRHLEGREVHVSLPLSHGDATVRSVFGAVTCTRATGCGGGYRASGGGADVWCPKRLDGMHQLCSLTHALTHLVRLLSTCLQDT